MVTKFVCVDGQLMHCVFCFSAVFGCFSWMYQMLASRHWGCLSQCLVW